MSTDAGVKRRVEAVTDACVGAVAEVIQEDTGLDAEHAFLLGVGLAGMAQACAARWVALQRPVPRSRAGALPRLELAGVLPLARGTERSLGRGPMSPSMPRGGTIGAAAHA